MGNKKVWFVTGASQGLGLSLVKQLLHQGYRVAATSRNVGDLALAVGSNAAGFLPLTMDLKSEASVQRAIEQTISSFGQIDVVVNNAGYGLLGGVEELTDQEARDNFDINVFGALHVIRNVMPYLRKQHSGHIFNIASVGGFTGTFPGAGIYCATKFAMAGFTESLSTEVRSFGVKVTLVLPGYFRTNFLAGSVSLPRRPIEEYREVRASVDMHTTTMNGNQQGDPDKAAAVMINVASEQQPPLHLFLGQDAYDLAYEKMLQVKKDLEGHKAATVSTGFGAEENEYNGVWVIENGSIRQEA